MSVPDVGRWPGVTDDLANRWVQTFGAVMLRRVPRDSDDLAPLDPLMVEAICDGDDPYRKQARKWVIV